MDPNGPVRLILKFIEGVELDVRWSIGGQLGLRTSTKMESALGLCLKEDNLPQQAR